MTNFIKSVTVFCGSRMGNNPAYIQAAKDLGKGLVQNKLRLVYGGGNVGLMGALSNTVLDNNGAIRGIIPEFLQQREALHTRVHDMLVTNDMHRRKSHLYAEGDAFVVLPGGLGTFDETVEIITWRQLQLHNKPIFILNIAQWAETFDKTLHAAVQQGFAEESILKLYEITPDVSTTLKRIRETLGITP